ncbi:MAG: hypothetical protein HQ512_06820 [Rhodospirillales bacterium]|nr:hypothetical protein [Rhodospirillales bacterium]
MAEAEGENGDCPREQSSQSKFSPGIVKNDEIVVRTLFEPEHVDEDGNLSAKSLTLKELQNTGASVDRLDKQHGTKFNILERAHIRIAGKKNRNWVLLSKVSASNIRQFLDESEQPVFCILDTALKENCAHADILFHSFGNLGNRGVLQVWRNRLVEAMETIRVEPSIRFLLRPTRPYLEWLAAFWRQIWATLVPLQGLKRK